MIEVAIILGYGPKVGVDVANAIARLGYRIAVVSRSGSCSESAKNYLQAKADLSDPSTVEDVFTRVIQELGHPSVVVYNGEFFN